MVKEYNEVTTESLGHIIKKCKGDPTFSLNFHEYLSNLIIPVFKSISGAQAHYLEYQVMCKECVNDIFMYVLEHENALYTNFNSYIRKRFEFYYINKLIAFNRLRERLVYSGDDIENQITNKTYSSSERQEYIGETFNDVLAFMNENREIFNLNDKIIVTYFTQGYNLNEISDLIGFSYGKTKAIFESVIFKLKNFYFNQIGNSRS